MARRDARRRRACLKAHGRLRALGAAYRRSPPPTLLPYLRLMGRLRRHIDAIYGLPDLPRWIAVIGSARTEVVVLASRAAMALRTRGPGGAVPEEAAILDAIVALATYAFRPVPFEGREYLIHGEPHAWAVGTDTLMRELLRRAPDAAERARLGAAFDAAAARRSPPEAWSPRQAAILAEHRAWVDGDRDGRRRRSPPGAGDGRPR